MTQMENTGQLRLFSTLPFLLVLVFIGHEEVNIIICPCSYCLSYLERAKELKFDAPKSLKKRNTTTEI